jgi:hypothetical protein
VRYVRVVHPNHPLSGQVVKVMRQTVHPAYAERCWIIEMPDHTWAKMPLSWAIAVDHTTELERRVVEEAAAELWVDVAGLLDLVTLVRHLTADQIEEAGDEGSSDLRPVEPRQAAAQDGGDAAPLAALVSGAATPDGTDPGGDVDATTALSSGTAGGAA